MTFEHVKIVPEFLKVSCFWLLGFVLEFLCVIATIAYRDFTCVGHARQEFCLCPCISLVDSFSTGILYVL
jgi:hypothetical protein